MLTELLEKYGNQKPMNLGSHIEKTIPVSAVIKMMEEYHESKVKNLSLGNVSDIAIIDYIEKDCEVAMPIDEMFNVNGSHITKKEYGKVLIKYLVKELRKRYC